jgi:hypothetical protein
MSSARLPDCQEALRDERTTSASAHPELTHGDFAMPPRIPVSHSADEGASVSNWQRRRFAVGILIATGLAALASFADNPPPGSTAGSADGQALAPACLQWHQMAGAVVARLAESTSDADLRQINDAVFRLRRARRNCEAGWVSLACRDYHAIARTPVSVGAREESMVHCPPMAGSLMERP